MTPEELDEARAKEADRLWGEAESRVGELSALQVAARLARENWTPPEPVDPDLLAFREFASKAARSASLAESYRDGGMDSCTSAHLFLAGARMAREQERERAKELVDQAKAIIDQHARLLARLPLGLRAEIGIEWQMMMDATASFYAKYRGEA